MSRAEMPKVWKTSQKDLGLNWNFEFLHFPANTILPINYQLQFTITQFKVFTVVSFRAFMKLPACRRLLFPLLHAEKHWTKEIGDRVCAQAISWNNAYTVYCIWYGAVVHYECRKKVIRNHEGVKFDSPKVELAWSQVTLTADCWLTYVATQWCPFYLKLSNKIAKAL